ncbi:hypothetical protein [Lentzea cavernae]|uniref:SUKH-4 immunity protein n=1 Tax=Lentzea cavernae TaxID=2020703 RepID=A0ABQ3MWN0_9PSEU|nr:hypothetical protein [Lentzea cavernae]GHH62990.1 hypothetical protein GCM10017774_91570 [Lentzea cavernae]
MGIDQLSDAGWPTGGNRPLLVMLFSPEELAERFGLAFVDDADDLGPLKLAVVQGSFGIAGLIRYADSPFAGTTVFVEDAADLELSHRTVVSEFGLTSSDIGWAVRSAGLLDVVRDSARLRELLAIIEFDVARTEVEGPVSIESGLALEPVAGDFTGGRFYLCGDAGGERQVLYASSEGQAGLIASNLREALQLIVGLPAWRDCLTFANGGSLEAMADAARRRQSGQVSPAAREAAELLSLDLPAQDVLLSRLHAAASRSAPEFVFRDDTGEHEGLF